MTLSSIAFFSSLFQVFFGALADNIKARNIYLAIVLFTTIASVSMIGVAPTFFVIGILTFISYLSNSAYHPLGASLAGHYGKGHHIAFFSFAGSLGSAFGPIFISWYAESFDLKFLNIFGILIAVIIAVLTLNLKKLKLYEKPSVKINFSILKTLFPIFLFVALRSFFMNVAHMYMPLYVNLLGGNLIFGGALLTLGTIAGTFSSLVGVFVRKKFGNIFVNFISVVGMFFSSFVFLLTTNSITLSVSYVMMDIFSFLSMSSNVVEAQHNAFKNRAFASSLVMGTAWSFGSAMNFVFSSIFGNNVPFVMKSLWVMAIFVGISIPFQIKVRREFLQ
jgi:FSR family fosmidomycin resistance protein-like MFS transporter